MLDVHMESPAATPTRPLTASAAATTTATDAPSAEEREEEASGIAFDLFDALDVELERRILRQLSHEVRDQRQPRSHS
jgi:hypothetical protein